MFTDTFTVDASGSADPIVIPAGAFGCTQVTLAPPDGHKWTLFLPAEASSGAPMSMDQQKVLKYGVRAVGQTIGAVVLDTGSGSMARIWE